MLSTSSVKAALEDTVTRAGDEHTENCWTVWHSIVSIFFIIAVIASSVVPAEDYFLQSVILIASAVLSLSVDYIVPNYNSQNSLRPSTHTTADNNLEIHTFRHSCCSFPHSTRTIYTCHFHSHMAESCFYPTLQSVSPCLFFLLWY